MTAHRGAEAVLDAAKGAGRARPAAASRSTRKGWCSTSTSAAETFFDVGRGAPLAFAADRPHSVRLARFSTLVAEALSNRATVAGYRIDISTPRDRQS